MTCTNIITVDADLDRHTLNFYLNKLKTILPKTNRVYIYKTKKGYHILAYLNEIVEEDKAYLLRKRLGDDPNRIRYEKRSKHTKKFSSMFTEKREINEVVL